MLESLRHFASTFEFVVQGVGLTLQYTGLSALMKGRFNWETKPLLHLMRSLPDPELEWYFKGFIFFLICLFWITLSTHPSE